MEASMPVNMPVTMTLDLTAVYGVVLTQMEAGALVIKPAMDSGMAQKERLIITQDQDIKLHGTMPPRHEHAQTVRCKAIESFTSNIYLKIHKFTCTLFYISNHLFIKTSILNLSQYEPY